MIKPMEHEAVFDLDPETYDKLEGMWKVVEGGHWERQLNYYLTHQVILDRMYMIRFRSRQSSTVSVAAWEATLKGPSSYGGDVRSCLEITQPLTLTPDGKYLEGLKDSPLMIEAEKLVPGIGQTLTRPSVAWISNLDYMDTLRKTFTLHGVDVCLDLSAIRKRGGKESSFRVLEIEHGDPRVVAKACKEFRKDHPTVESAIKTKFQRFLEA